MEAEHTLAIIFLIFSCCRYTSQYGKINKINKKHGKYSPTKADKAPHTLCVIMPPTYTHKLNIGPGIILIKEKPL
jgi:hypothetical protein